MNNFKKPKSEDRLRIIIRSDIAVESATEPHLGIYARVDRDPTVRIWLPVTDATDTRKAADELLKAGLNFFDLGIIRRKLALALEDVKASKLNVAVKSGWHGNSFVYNGMICTLSDEYPRLHQNIRTRYDYPSIENDHLLDFVDVVGRESDFVAAATMVAFAQPLLGLQVSSERPIIYFWGESRTGKTTLGKMICALTRPPSDRTLFTFDSTPRAFEEALHRCSDNVAVFDELSALTEAEIERVLSSFIYTAANGRGRSRSAGCAYPDLRWRTTAVVTGETNLDTLSARRRGSGQDARIVALRVPPRTMGGIWTGCDVADGGGEELTEKLERLALSYSGHSYIEWIKWLVRNCGDARDRLQRTANEYVSQLTLENSDSLARSTAKHFAHLAAAGDELMKACIIDWPTGHPFEVMSRLYRAHLNPSEPEERTGDIARVAALEILAHVGTGRITVAKYGEGAKAEDAYISERGEERFVMIDKQRVPDFLSMSPKDAIESLRISGAIRSSGSSRFVQGPDRKDKKRYLRLALSDLETAAFRVT